MPGTSLKRRIERDLFFLGGVAIGARLMYMLDPDRGRCRRAMARDRAVWVFHKVQNMLDRSLRDFANRVQGVAASVASDLVPEPVDDTVLVQRVRAKLGRTVSHPGAIEVAATGGAVTLKGAVLQQEERELLWAVRSVPGVTAVESQLKPHPSADTPELQGAVHAPAPFELLRSSWKPATRMVVGTAGLGLAAYGLYRRDVPGALLGLFGLGAAVRSAVNERIIPLPGLAEPAHGIELQKTMHFNAPVEQVFALLADPTKFPEFMPHVREVRQTDPGRYHWTLSGPLHAPIGWEAEVVRLTPKQLIEWRSLPGAAVENHGSVHFAEEAGGTRVHIQLSYRPPAGIFVHTLAEIFGADPKAMLDEDLVRVKSLLERGKTRVHHHEVSLAQVGG